jgi:hypothetical protein
LEEAATLRKAAARDWLALTLLTIIRKVRVAAGGTTVGFRTYDVTLADLYGDGLYAEHAAQASSLLNGLIENRNRGISRLRAALTAFRAKLPKQAKIILLGRRSRWTDLLTHSRRLPAPVQLLRQLRNLWPLLSLIIYQHLRREIAA